MLGQRVTPLDRVGIYVPGGKAAYPSSVLMNAMPAQVAGVREIVMVVPDARRRAQPAGAGRRASRRRDRVFTIGGAQAIAALAYGTATVPAVDKICGPGNAYVAAAKRRVFGTVGIDMVAGASEILVIADGTANPDWVAMDLFAQAEHDEMAQAILLTPDAALLDARCGERAAAARATCRARAIIAASLASRGALIKTRDLDEACAIVNRIAPEHLELAVADPGRAAAAHPPRRRDLPRPLRVRGARRLLRRAEPRAADRPHGALLLAARRLRFPEALERAAASRARARRRSAPIASTLARGEGLDRARALGRSAIDKTRGRTHGQGHRDVQDARRPGGVRPLLLRHARADREDSPGLAPLRGDSAASVVDAGRRRAPYHLVAMLTFDSRGGDPGRARLAGGPGHRRRPRQFRDRRRGPLTSRHRRPFEPIA